MTPEIFTEAGHRELAAVLLGDGAEEHDPGRLRERLGNEAAVSLLSRFLIAEPPTGNASRMAGECVRRLRRFALQARVDGLLDALREADRARDRERVEALQIELGELYRELKVSV